MNITVYLGANEGNDPSLRKAVQELGTWIGASGNALVYGGSKTGLMGEIAKSVLDAGGNVTGVEPQFFMDEGFQYDGLTELIVTKDMSERKNKMIELGDAAGHGVGFIGQNGLHGVHDQDLRLDLLHCVQNGFQVVFRQNIKILAADVQPVGTEFDLSGGFLTGNI